MIFSYALNLPPSCHAYRCLQGTSVTLQPFDLPPLSHL